jgi:hypothetical protein
MKMEDTGIFPGLQKLAPADSHLAQVFMEEHQKDDELTRRITERLHAEGSPIELPSAAEFEEWLAALAHHLEKEEAEITSLTVKTGANPEERGVWMNKVAISPAFSADKEELSWFIGWNIRTLSKFGSTKNTPLVAARVFAHGVQCSCTVSQWRELREVVRVNTPAEQWDDMVANYRLDGNGFIQDA